MHSHVSLGSNQTYCKLYSNQNLFTPLQYPCNAIYSLSLSLPSCWLYQLMLCSFIYLKFCSCHGNSGGEDRLWPRAGGGRVIKLFPGFESTILFEIIITSNMPVPAFCAAKSILPSAYERDIECFTISDSKIFSTT